ncbi:unnamed protein product [Prunus brigantina]
MWTINDFPAYGNLSGYSTKGEKACPVCGVDTCSKWLTHSRKCVYMNHRRFLAHNHPFRGKARWFDGTIECGRKPRILTGSEVFQVVKNFNNDWGKAKKKENPAENAKCKLLNWIGTSEIVGIGEIASTDPNSLVHHVPLGHECWKVWVNDVMDDNVALYRPTREFFLLREALGTTIAWPIKYIKLC